MKSFVKVFVLLIFALNINSVYSQTAKKPKLVVGIVVDQMRFEYLYRFNPYFSEGGFKRLMHEGSNFTYAHYNYMPTHTGPGHASIYTGSVPFYHGIISNNYYDRVNRKTVNCVVDPNQKGIGSNDDEGARSPHRLLSTTITDQLKLSTAGRSKVISVSIKDRGAVLPGGHFPDGAYWYDRSSGNFITSSYYHESLPDWVEKFNKRGVADSCMSGDWQLLLPEEDYAINPPDDSKYEKDMFKEGKTYFPHSFENLKGNDKVKSIVYTPYGNYIIAEMAKAALTSEKLGQGNVTDFLAISFSSTDYVGHEYGTVSYELQDTYIRLDRVIADLLETLDKKLGKDNYLLFLTGDHAGMKTQAFLKDSRIPVGGLRWQSVFDSLTAFTKREYNHTTLIESYSNKQIFLNRDVIRKEQLDIDKVERNIANYIRDTFPEVASIFTRRDLETQIAQRVPISYILNGYNPSRSGDIAFSFQPGFLGRYHAEGTQHGSYYAYDTHVPMLYYGWRVPAQTVNSPVYVCDIAATIANLLKITEPSTCIGIPLIIEE